MINIIFVCSLYSSEIKRKVAAFHKFNVFLVNFDPGARYNIPVHSLSACPKPSSLR